MCRQLHTRQDATCQSLPVPSNRAILEVLNAVFLDGDMPAAEEIEVLAEFMLGTGRFAGPDEDGRLILTDGSILARTTAGTWAMLGYCSEGTLRCLLGEDED